MIAPAQIQALKAKAHETAARARLREMADSVNPRPVTSACPDSRETTSHPYWRPEILRAIVAGEAPPPARHRALSALAYATIFTLTASSMLRRFLP